MSPNRGKANHPQHRENPTRGAIRSPSQADQRPDMSRRRDKVTRDDQPTHGPAVCTRCQAIYHHKHWHLPGRDQANQLGLGEVMETVCPGCVKVERQEYDGHVVISGPFVEAHHDEILGLIRNTESHIREHNPIARVAQLTEAPDRVEVLTISPFLAERIGKELSKAYDGQLEIQHPEREEFTRVTWIRD